MQKATDPVPQGYHTMTPTLTVKDAAKAIEFYKKAFGAEERDRYLGPDGKSIMHAEMKIGDSIFMLNDEFPDMSCYGPQKLGGTPVTFYIYVEDVDAAWDRAVKAGATITMPIADMFWGDRYGQVADPFGHKWSLASHKYEMTPEEMKEAQQKWQKEMAGARK